MIEQKSSVEAGKIEADHIEAKSVKMGEGSNIKFVQATITFDTSKIVNSLESIRKELQDIRNILMSKKVDVKLVFEKEKEEADQELQLHDQHYEMKSNEEIEKLIKAINQAIFDSLKSNYDKPPKQQIK